MGFNCHLCSRFSEHEYMYFQHLHVEHRYFKCEICSMVSSSKHAYNQHGKMHTQSEFDMVKNRWESEKERWYEKERKFWARGLASESIDFMFKILNELKTIVIEKKKLTSIDFEEIVSRWNYEV